MSAFETGNKLREGPNGEPLNKTSITTWSGHVIDLAKPAPDCVYLDDIARGLSQHVRWAGQGEHWLSVAQHSVLVLRTMEAQARDEGWWPSETLMKQALMHDAHEAYIGDLSGGLKWLLRDSELKGIVLDLQLAIEYAIGFDGTALPGYSEAIKKAEDYLVPFEFSHLHRHMDVTQMEGSWCRDIAMEIFLSEAERLGLGRGGPDV